MSSYQTEALQVGKFYVSEYPKTITTFGTEYEGAHVSRIGGPFESDFEAQAWLETRVGDTDTAYVWKCSPSMARNN